MPPIRGTIMIHRTAILLSLMIFSLYVTTGLFSELSFGQSLPCATYAIWSIQIVLLLFESGKVLLHGFYITVTI